MQRRYDIMVLLHTLILKHSAVLYINASRTLTLSAVRSGKLPESFWQKKRKLNNSYGVLADTPDWSFLDGRPAPPGALATQRKAIQRQICERIILLLGEIEKAKKTVVNRKRLTIQRTAERRAAKRFEAKHES